MFLNWYNTAFLCALVAASIDIKRGGWLDQIVEFHKQKFYKELIELAPIQIEATIQRAPPGYTDSKDWTYDSVTRLLVLISESERARPVKIALRRMLSPTRRLSISKHQSYKVFPSLSKNIVNYMYYDMDTDTEYLETEQFPGVTDEQAVVVVTNPVEARLPSAQISVKLLRDILEARAKAARVMPSTTRKTIPWKVMNTTKAAGTNDSDATITTTGGAEAVTVAEGNSTGGEAVTGAPTAAKPE